MTITFAQFLIVCPLVFLGGFIDAVAGGGGLVSLTAYLIAGLPPHNAIATNKLSSCFGTLTATARYAKDGYIPWKQALCCVAFALIGSATGAELALLIDAEVFKLAMLVILPVTAFYVFRSKALISEKEPLPSVKTTVISCTLALFLGVYDGIYGPGTGTFLILLLTALAHMSIESANGTAKVINLCTNTSALAVFIVSGKVVYAVGLVAALFSVAGNMLGVRCFEKGGSRAVKPIMITVLGIFFVKVLYELILGL